MKTLPSWVKPKLNQVMQTKSHADIDGRVKQSAEEGQEVRKNLVQEFDYFEAMDNGDGDVDLREGAVRFKMSTGTDHYYQVFTERRGEESMQWSYLTDQEGTEVGSGVSIKILRADEAFGLAFNKDGPSSGNYVGPEAIWFKRFKRPD